MTSFGGVSVELVCEACGVAYKAERHFGDWWEDWVRQNGKLVERGLCGRCTANWLRIDVLDRREELRQGYKVKYVHGAGYVKGIVVVKKRYVRRKRA